MKNSTGFLPFRKVGVLGAGVMGAQIAAHLANAGLEVVLLDIAAKEGNKNSIVEGAFKKIQKLKPAPFASKEAMERITLGNFDEHMSLLKDAEWVIEAVIEHLPIKQDLMQKLEAVVGEQTIISTNTSGLPIHKIAEGRSESFQRRFLGTHFFNPENRSDDSGTHFLVWQDLSRKKHRYCERYAKFYCKPYRRLCHHTGDALFHRWRLYD